MYVSDFIEFQVTPSFRDADFLRQKYLVERLSSQQIADLTGSSRTTISRHLKMFKIPLRSEAGALKLRKAQPAYGERWHDGKVVPCKRELEVVAMIRNLRAQGMGLQSIADFLNTTGIPTKSKRAKWKPATLWYILKRDEV